MLFFYRRNRVVSVGQVGHLRGGYFWHFGPILQLKRAEVWNLLKGFNIGNFNVSVSHLQFVDDTILLYKANDMLTHNLRSILKCFERISGLVVFMEKELHFIGG